MYAKINHVQIFSVTLDRTLRQMGLDSEGQVRGESLMRSWLRRGCGSARHRSRVAVTFRNRWDTKMLKERSCKC